MSHPLEGIRVLDLTRLLPGPLCTLWLAELGAEIWKVEPPGGDYTRWYPPIRQTMSGIFATLNRNKRSLALDLKHPDAVDALLALVEQVDIVVEGFRPGVMARMGLGEEVLRARNPRLIYCAITGYGQDGPMAPKAGHDINFLARSGVLDLQRQADQTLPLVGIQVADIAGGSMAALSGILAALYQRERTGKGASCDIAMSESLLSFLVMELGQRQAGLHQEPYEDFLRGSVPCYGVYRCQDNRFLSVAALEPKFWEAFVAVLDIPHLADAGLERGEEGERVRQELASIFASQPLAHWVERFAHVDACVEPVLTLDELSEDAHWKARGAWEEHEHPLEGRFFLPRSPIRLREQLPAPSLPAPQIGQDGHAILSSAGFSQDAITALQASGALFLPASSKP